MTHCRCGNVAGLGKIQCGRCEREAEERERQRVENQVWILFWLPQVGDEVVEGVFRSEEDANEARASKEHPGQWDVRAYDLK